jgi:hypothetical protein
MLKLEYQGIQYIMLEENKHKEILIIHSFIFNIEKKKYV